jgi:hypothetical protein
MALTVENGTGGDALVSLNDFEVYCEEHGYDLTAFTDPEEEVAIRNASTYISRAFSYKGLKVGARHQIQAWPRYGVWDEEGYGVDYTTVPWEVVDATCEAAWYDLNNPGKLNPNVVITERALIETVGPISVTYESRRGLGTNVNDSRPILTIIGDLLAPLLSPNASSVTVRAVRG